MVRTLAATTDNRRSRGFPVARKVVAISVNPASSSTSFDATTEINGELVAFVYDIPTLSGSTDERVTFNFKDEDGTVWHTKTPLSASSIALEKLLADTSPQRFGFTGTATFNATTVRNQISATTINVVAYMK